MSRASQKGFTLIEIMVVVAILGILATIAYPSFQDSVRKSRRTDGKSALLNSAALQEKWYFQHNQYTANVADLAGATSTEGYYAISVTQPCGTSNCFTIVATALGDQLNDDDCRTFFVTHVGAKTSTNSGGADSTAICWR